MANFIKATQRIKTGKLGAPTKSGKARDKRFECRATEDELALIDELVAVLHKRRQVGNTRMDMLMYLVEREYAKQDEIRVISKVEGE